MTRWPAFCGVFGLGCALALGCGSGGEGTGNSGLTSGGVGGMFPTGGVGGTPGGAGGAAGMAIGGMGAAGMIAGGTGGVAGMIAGGTGGVAGMVTGGMGGVAGGMTGGIGGIGGMAGMTGGSGGTPVIGDGDCCPDGNCVCHNEPPSALSTADGPYDVATYELTTGTVYYPTDAEPPLSAIAICPGFLNSGPEMAPWGPFYASHGFVLIATHTLGSDFPDIRAAKLLAAIDELKAENTDSSSPLSGKLAGRYGTSGYSMGGGGTTIASTTDPSLKTSIGLAAWGPVGAGVTTPTLLLCGLSDGTAPCNMSQGSYGQIPDATPKMMLSIPGASHFAWFAPDGAGSGTGASGARALAFQKVYLDGDTRWHDLLISAPSGGELTTNID